MERRGLTVSETSSDGAYIQLDVIDEEDQGNGDETNPTALAETVPTERVSVQPYVIPDSAISFVPPDFVESTLQSENPFTTGSSGDHYKARNPLIAVTTCLCGAVLVVVLLVLLLPHSSHKKSPSVITVYYNDASCTAPLYQNCLPLDICLTLYNTETPTSLIYSTWKSNSLNVTYYSNKNCQGPATSSETRNLGGCVPVASGLYRSVITQPDSGVNLVQGEGSLTFTIDGYTTSGCSTSFTQELIVRLDICIPINASTSVKYLQSTLTGSETVKVINQYLYSDKQCQTVSSSSPLQQGCFFHREITVSPYRTYDIGGFGF